MKRALIDLTDSCGSPPPERQERGRKVKASRGSPPAVVVDLSRELSPANTRTRSRTERTRGASQPAPACDDVVCVTSRDLRRPSGGSRRPSAARGSAAQQPARPRQDDAVRRTSQHAVSDPSSQADAVLARRLQEADDAQLARQQQDQLVREHATAAAQRRQDEAQAALDHAGKSIATWDRGGRQRSTRPSTSGRRHSWGLPHFTTMGMDPFAALGMDFLSGPPRFGPGGHHHHHNMHHGLPGPGLGHPDHHHRGGQGAALREAVAGAGRLPMSMLFSARNFDENDYEALLALDEGNTNRRGAKKKDVVRMTAETLTVPAGGPADPSTTCTICLEDVCAGAVLRKLKCSHSFHKTCIDRWLQTKAACPICGFAPD